MKQGQQYISSLTNNYAGSYRFGFNGKEKDDETYGNGNEYNYGFRIYNPRIGRFLTVDLLSKKYPELSTFQYASNRPIQCIDLDGLEAYFNNSGEFIEWGKDQTKTAPVILKKDGKDVPVGLTIEQFKNRVYFMTGEGAKDGSKTSRYYAHTIKNAKSFGFHGEGFSENQTLNALWKDKKYNKDDFLAGLPNEKKTKNYQPYKKAFPLKDNLKKWSDDMTYNAKEIIQAETGQTSDPTRGATNWGGGERAYNYNVSQFGSENVIKLEEGKSVHVFMNLNTGKLNPPQNSEPTPTSEKVPNGSSPQP